MSFKNNTKIGRKGEDIAIQFLLENSYEIVKRNYYSNQGEIDIIALDDEELVFIEVKTRVRDLETALASMSPTKCKKIIRTAEDFLSKNSRFEDHFTRFDLLVVILNSKEPVIHHIKEAISF
ncbi:MAG: hypothetical protein APR54_03065 [Candidatus Cloacimonas sp. SDB]|jgi:putative endonuclease|nr:MAG: hypothetical protein APR54_03065 [Candidatus Cloacimonas sp. SDB]